MKTIKYIALGVLATSMTLANTSCSDSFLEVENPSGENLEEYYTTDHRKSLSAFRNYGINFVKSGIAG